MFKKKRVSLVEKLKVIADKSNTHIHRQEANTILNYYLRNGRMSVPMSQRGMELVKYNTDIVNPFGEDYREVKDTRYYLYAISNGDCIKVGYSNKPQKRLKELQVSSPYDLEIVWSTFCALDREEAMKQEGYLHKKLGRYALRGEWFDNRCLPIIESHVVRSRDAKQDRKAEKINDRLDSEYLAVMCGIL